MSATLAVEELEVDPKRVAVAGDTDREASLHLVEEQGALALFVFGDAHRLAGTWRHEHLGLESRRGDLGGLRDLGGKDPVFDQEDIGVEPGTFVTCDHLAHRPVHADQLTRGEHPLQGDDVVELDELAITHPDPEFERGGVTGSENSADHLVHRDRE